MPHLYHGDQRSNRRDPRPPPWLPHALPKNGTRRCARHNITMTVHVTGTRAEHRLLGSVQLRAVTSFRLTDAWTRTARRSADRKRSLSSPMCLCDGTNSQFCCRKSLWHEQQPIATLIVTPERLSSPLNPSLTPATISN